MNITGINSLAKHLIRTLAALVLTVAAAVDSHAAMDTHDLTNTHDLTDSHASVNFHAATDSHTATDSHAQGTDSIATFRTWALTPPMGWNSWDCYYSSVNEALTMQNAKYIVDKGLNKYGWEYVVVDIRWYCNHPSLGGGTYNQNGTQDYVLDEYGRYLPSPTRFPSAMVGGKNQGFKAMADSLHNMGLKFGIHIMRGVPKSVVGSSYKLKGAEDVAWSKVYASTTPPCTWLKDNLLVRNNEYGQLYYNSIIDLYAEWGVDFIKVDDISRPFYTDEIKMLRKAIDQCGRPIVLSLSPGKTQYTYAESCLENANMWRMMDDLWDSWSYVDLVFNEANEWSKYTRPGNYADCDMLPLGQIAMTVADAGYTRAQSGRWTRLTENEQYSMMTLWGICHSPLFFGGEMTKNDDFTNSLLTNEEYLYMHNYAVDAHQVANDEDNGQVVWTSLDPATGNRYLALFQRDDTKARTGLISRTGTKAKEVEFDITGAEQLKIVVSNYNDGYSYDRADIINPVLIDEAGNETSLTTLSHASYTSQWGSLHKHKNVEGGTLKVDGTTYTTGLGLNAECTLVYNLPEGHAYKTFKALCGYDSSCDTDNKSTTGTTMEFLFYTTTNEGMSVDLTQFGYAADEAVPVYDIWAKQSIGEAKGTISAKVPSHGAKLFRLGNNKESAIESITKDEAKQMAKSGGADAIYDMSGRKIACDFNHLQSGIYILNGKKYLVK